MLKLYRRWRRIRQTKMELAVMSDRELNDIGISRYDIDRVAKQAA